MMEFSAHLPAQCVTNNTTGITEHQRVSNIIDTRTDTIPTCCIIQPCDIHMYICHLQRFLPDMARINTQISA